LVVQKLPRAGCGGASPPPRPAPRQPALLACAEAHEAASLPFLDSGDYGGEHWLATFAALAADGL
ncbi:DUF2891 family protein, partial [Ferrovibrio sp.]|uniref:DUF2891 family protein n=1 Tax=Ferrovibrio sp. TaxID=1917215 RepID=UPI00311D4F17